MLKIGGGIMSPPLRIHNRKGMGQGSNAFHGGD